MRTVSIQQLGKIRELTPGRADQLWCHHGADARQPQAEGNTPLQRLCAGPWEYGSAYAQQRSLAGANWGCLLLHDQHLQTVQLGWWCPCVFLPWWTPYFLPAEPGTETLFRLQGMVTAWPCQMLTKQAGLLTSWDWLGGSPAGAGQELMWERLQKYWGGLSKLQVGSQRRVFMFTTTFKTAIPDKLGLETKTSVLCDRISEITDGW